MRQFQLRRRLDATERNNMLRFCHLRFNEWPGIGHKDHTNESPIYCRSRIGRFHIHHPAV